MQGLYRGVGPSIGRAMSLNMGMLASNDQVSISLNNPSQADFSDSLCSSALTNDLAVLCLMNSRSSLNRVAKGFWQQSFMLLQS